MGIFAHDGKLAQILTTLGNLMVLNILTLLCSIPVITIGPAAVALFNNTIRIARGEDGPLISQYFSSFRANFKQAAILWVLMGGCIAFMAFDIYLLAFLEGALGQVYQVVLLVLIILFTLVSIYGFALMARFDNTMKNTLKNAWILSIGKPLPAIVFLLFMFLLVGLLAISYRFIPVLFLLGISGPAYLSSMYFTSLFQKFENQSAR